MGVCLFEMKRQPAANVSINNKNKRNNNYNEGATFIKWKK